MLALALEEPLPVRARAGSGADVGGGVWVEEPLRPRTLAGWEAEPLRWVWEEG